MRMSRKVKAQHHAEIVDAASKILRTRGIEGTTAADLMQTAGLTHSGFYRHFSSKDALISEATGEAFSGISRNTKRARRRMGPRSRSLLSLMNT
jgi:TetR/AcrR family transcriptional regulator, transcriptional repressor for nem operon